MDPKPKALKILDIVSVILFLVAVYLALVFTPLEAVMGWVQKVFYFHVATAWVGMMGFMAAGIAGIIYLWKKDLKWDIVEVAAVEISMVFFGITIVMGSIWARPIWNTWWTWDPRLTTAAITMMVYAAYMMLRQGIEEPERRARFGAVYTILGFVAVPITFISIRLLRTIHPVVVGKDHPNAILYDDMGTLDPADDIYHHAFRIGFNSPNAGRTTNSLNLKRWFENEYTDEDESPGFNIPQALEFYPDNNGTSATSGVVKVVSQDLLISGKQGDGSLVAYTLYIEGEGEYMEIRDGVFEITLELRVTNMELFGGTRLAKYKIFNTSDYDDPIDLTEGCFQPMEL